MKFTATTALAAIASLASARNHHVAFTHLELAQMERVEPSATEAPIRERLELAEVGGTETVGDVTHPDDAATEVTFLDRSASSKTEGFVSYQMFFNEVVDSITTLMPNLS